MRNLIKKSLTGCLIVSGIAVILLVFAFIIVPYCYITGQSLDVIIQSPKMSALATVRVQEYYKHYNDRDFAYIYDNMMIHTKNKEKHKKDIYEYLTSSYNKYGKFVKLKNKSCTNFFI
jgi:hypothetical protein